ncbi:Ig-like domain-containing protein [Halioxenophilus aromaticivorans]|uniref:PKD/Chitinase domain-containing protein n=1 Tax=Halioxenophilus aromaticivorans TaxID=1306992 RepID=A0AAV3U3C1_9ALTE
MSIVIENIVGSAGILNADGSITPVSVGDVIPDDAVLQSIGGEAVITTDQGELNLLEGLQGSFNIAGDSFFAANEDSENLLFDDSLDNLLGELNTAGVETNEDLDIAALLEGDGDILESLEETAAGLSGGGGAEGGSSFVRVARVAEDSSESEFDIESANNEPEQEPTFDQESTQPPQDPDNQDPTPANDPVADAPQEEVAADDAQPDAQADDQADNQADNQADTQADAQADNQADTQADAQADTQADAQVDNQADTQADTQADSQADSQADTQTDTQADTQANNGADAVDQGTANDDGADTTATGDGADTDEGATDAGTGAESGQATNDEAANDPINDPANQPDNQNAATDNGAAESTGGGADGTADAGVDQSAPASSNSANLALEPVAITNNTTPTLSGSTDFSNGETITFVVTDATGASQTFNAVTQPDGSFTVDIPADLAEGDFTVDISAVDAEGNPSAITSTGTIDQTPPALSVDNPATSNDATPEVTGTTDLPAGSTVAVTFVDANGASETIDAIVQPDGSFSAQPTGDLAEGNYTVDVVVTDEAGNTTTSTQAGNFDPSAPELTVDDIGLGNDATPTVSGTTSLPASEQISVTVTDSAGNIQTFTIPVEPDGSFAAEVPADLANGAFTVEVSATDAAGNTASTTKAGEVDTVAPEVTVTDQALSNDGTPTITGTTNLPAGESVAITVTDANGNVQTFDATVQPDGSFTAEVPADLADGAYTVEVTATDAAGNSATDAKTGDVDTTAPTVTVNDPGLGNDATPTVSGTTDLPAGETIAITVTDANGNAQTFDATVQPDGTFTADVPADLAEGNYTVEVTATDAAGNSSSDSKTGEVDTTAPTVSVDDPALGNDATPTISGTTNLPASETVSITVTDSNGDAQTFDATVQPDGSYSADVPADLAEGSYTVDVTAIDVAGNSASDSKTGEVDVTAPTVSVDDPGLGNDATPTISGTTNLPAGETVSIIVTDSNGDAQTFDATVQPDGSYSANVPADLAEGNYTVDVTAADAAGNSATESKTGEVDVTAPTVSVDDPGLGNDATPTISGTTNLPAGETVSITVADSNGDAQTFDATVQPDGSYSTDVPADLAEGNYTVDVTATDAAGNSATDSKTGEVDVTAPTVSVDDPGLGNDATPTISGTTNLPAGETVSITVADSNGDAQTFDAPVQPDGSYSADVPADLAGGNYTVEVTATDAAGNSAADSKTGEVDTNAPTVSVDDPGLGNDATPTISGTTNLPAGETVSITVTDSNGDAQTFDATVQPDGSYSADVPADLAEGNYTVDVTATDAVGNSATDSKTGEVDVTAPTVTVNDPGLGNDATPTISGTTNLPAGETVSITVTDSNGDAQTFDATVQPDGSYSADVPADLAEGNYTAEVSVSDAAGNTSSDSKTGELDTTAPNISVDNPGVGSDTTPTITGTTDLPAGETVAITVTDSNGDAQTFNATVQPDGSYSADVPADLAEGNYTVDVSATDAAGNSSSASTTGDIDSNVPDLTIGDLIVTNDVTPTISGTTNLAPGEDVSITVTDANSDTQTLTATVQPDGTFSIEVPTALAEGTYTVTATATNDVGNSATTSKSGEIDTTAPQLTIDEPGIGNDITPTISGSTDLPAVATVSITVTDPNGDAQTFDATVQPDGTFSADVPADIAEGSYTVDVTATDAAGNSSTDSKTGEVDVTAPTVSVNDPGLGNDATPTIAGTTNLPAGETVSITVTDSNGDAQTFDATVQPDGSYSADVPTDLAEGNYTVEVTATDAAGNSTTDSKTGEVDTAAPVVTVDDPALGNDATPTIAGTTNLPAGETVSITVTDSNGDAQTFNATVQPNGSYSADVPADLAEGNYTVDVTATDAAGNSATDSKTGEVDVTAPTVSVDDPELGNDATPTISGTTNLPAGETVSITVTDSNGDAQTFDANVQLDGSYSADVPVDLAEGNYSVDVTAIDAAGNSATDSKTGEVDITAPTVTVNDPGLGNDATPTIAGTTNLPAGETVSITVTDSNGDAQTFDATVQPDGSYSADVPTDLAEGNYTVDVTATDAAGNSATDSKTGEVDVTAPTVSVDDPGLGNDATPTISGTTNLPAGESVSITVTDANGDAQTFDATVQPDGSYSADVPADLAEGNYTVDVTATDAAGNSATDSKTGEIDVTAPTVTVNDPGLGNDATPTIAGTTNLPAGETVSITVTDSNGDAQTFDATVQPDGSFSADVPTDLAEGNYTVDVTATDAAGNSATDSKTGEVDVTAPTVTVNDPGLGNDATPTISGTTNLPAGETVSIAVTDANGDAQTFNATVQPDGSYSADVPTDLAEGNYTVDVTATDAAGNSATDSKTGEVDVTAPTVTVNDPGLGNDATPTIAGTTNLPAGETVSITVTDSNGDAQTFDATVQPDGSFSADVPTDLAEGNYTVDVTATDAAGNSATDSKTGDIDVTAPTVTVNDPGLGNDATPTISGTTNLPAGETVSIAVTDANGDAQTFNATVQPDGSYSADVPTDLAEGTYTVDVTATDAAGNSATDSTSGDLDITAPTVTVNNPGLDNDATPTISGTTNLPAGEMVSITVTDANGDAQTFAATVQPDGSYAADVPSDLAEGNYTVEVTATDAAGNSSSATGTGEVDTTNPLLLIDDITSTNDTTPTISGQADVGVGTIVTVVVSDSNGIEQTLAAVVQVNGSWSADVPLPLAEGAVSITATVNDEAGNIVNVSAGATVDTTPPSLIVDAIGDTNDTTPTISGQADVGVGTIVTVVVSDSNGIEQTLAAVVQVDGSWSTDVPLPLAEGTVSITATVNDDAGNIVNVSAGATVDTTPPSLIVDAIGDTDDTTPTISGQADVGVGTIVTVVVSDSNGIEQTLAAVVQVDGSWSADVPLPLAEGGFTITAIVNDEAGNIVNVGAAATIDTTPPVLNLNDIGNTNDTTPIISGTTDAGLGALVDITIEDFLGNVQTLQATVQVGGSFSVEVPTPIVEGAFTVEAVLTQGGTTTTNITANVDLTPPTLVVNALGTINDATPTITGSSNAIGAAVQVDLIDGNGDSQSLVGVVLGDGTFSVDVPVDVSEGNLTVEVSVLDDAGNETTDISSALVDLTLPLLTVDVIGLTNDSTPTISGTSDEIGATVTITTTDGDSNEQVFSTVVDGAGHFSGDIPFDVADGLLSVDVSIADIAGNISTTSTSGTIDTIAPNLVVTKTPSLLTPYFAGTCDPDLAGQTINIDVTANILGIETDLTISTNVLPDGTWQTGPILNLSLGPISASISVEDQAGNLLTVTENTTVNSTDSGGTEESSGGLLGGSLLSLDIGLGGLGIGIDI